MLSGDKDTTEFNLVLTDPCNPPETLDAPALPNQSYQITAAEVSYQVPSFVTDPTYCINKVTYTSTVTPLQNGESAVTTEASNRDFKFFYDKDRTPVDDTIET